MSVSPRDEHECLPNNGHPAARCRRKAATGAAEPKAKRARCGLRDAAGDGDNAAATATDADAVRASKPRRHHQQLSRLRPRRPSRKLPASSPGLRDASGEPGGAVTRCCYDHDDNIARTRRIMHHFAALVVPNLDFLEGREVLVRLAAACMREPERRAREYVLEHPGDAVAAWLHAASDGRPRAAVATGARVCAAGCADEWALTVDGRRALIVALSAACAGGHVDSLSCMARLLRAPVVATAVTEDTTDDDDDYHNCFPWDSTPLGLRMHAVASACACCRLPVLDALRAAHLLPSDADIAGIRGTLVVNAACGVTSDEPFRWLMGVYGAQVLSQHRWTALCRSLQVRSERVVDAVVGAFPDATVFCYQDEHPWKHPVVRATIDKMPCAVASMASGACTHLMARRPAALRRALWVATINDDAAAVVALRPAVSAALAAGALSPRDSVADADGVPAFHRVAIAHGYGNMVCLLRSIGFDAPDRTVAKQALACAVARGYISSTLATIDAAFTTRDAVHIIADASEQLRELAKYTKNLGAPMTYGNEFLLPYAHADGEDKDARETLDSLRRIPCDFVPSDLLAMCDAALACVALERNASHTAHELSSAIEHFEISWLCVVVQVHKQLTCK
eukprot:TRINITY_DN5662_c0_g1_i1.p1 TRINITY_DN5662_c0_g1~~TRINITY_DN5662_c0_g1_i1.p1  ORF type:complete len:626 (-),score=116.92 TRINITY_DN5662_c0_g1_i1:52-1929(-)